MRKAVLQNYSDLEFLSLADKIARDYKTLLTHLFETTIDVSNENDLTACRILMACFESEEPMSTDDLEQFLRLDTVDFSRALIKLIGLEYAYKQTAENDRQSKLVNLTDAGTEVAKKYQWLFDEAVGQADAMSKLRLTDIERDNIVLSLISLQNRTSALIRKRSS